MNTSLTSATGPCDRDTEAQPPSHTGEIRKGDQGGIQIVLDNVLSSRVVGPPECFTWVARARCSIPPFFAGELSVCSNLARLDGLYAAAGLLVSCFIGCWRGVWVVLLVCLCSSCFNTRTLCVPLRTLFSQKPISMYTILCTYPSL